MSSKSYSWTPDAETITKLKNALNREEIQSPVFEMHGFRWSFRIYPNGDSPKKESNVNWFLWMTSMPPKYSQIGVDLKLELIEANVESSFPATFSDKHLTRGWITGTLKTCDIQNLQTMEFKVTITVHDVYGRNGELLEKIEDCDNKEQNNDDYQNMPVRFKHQSSELVLQNKDFHADLNESRLDSLTLKIEELTLNMDNMQSKIQSAQEESNEFTEQLSLVVNEMKDMKKILLKCLAKQTDHNVLENVDEKELNEQQQKLKLWFENDVKLPEYFSFFLKNGIEDLSVAKLVEMENLTEMGIDTLGHRIQILYQIRCLQKTSSPN